jgi:hypothetical protein
MQKNSFPLKEVLTTPRRSVQRDDVGERSRCSQLDAKKRRNDARHRASMFTKAYHCSSFANRDIDDR